MISKINYQNKLLELIKNLERKKPKLLLHSCCGPCSTEVIDFLKNYFEITVYYYNPNIEPKEEYLRRKSEQIRFITEFNKNNNNLKVSFLDCDYDNEKFKKNSQNLENEPEGGVRCNKCFYLRLYNTALTAKEKEFAYFGTTLTISPHKNSQIINEIGAKIATLVGINFIYGDFKKNDGYKKSIEFSKIYNLYRQNYCGCLYGKENNNGNK